MHRYALNVSVISGNPEVDPIISQHLCIDNQRVLLIIWSHNSKDRVSYDVANEDHLRGAVVIFRS